MRLVSIRCTDGELVDRGMVAWFAGPNSFTGEDCAEFHLHGSRAVVARLLAELAAYPGLRAAEAGEFTLRAFRNGRIDLTEAEALSDLIAAETEVQRKFALQQGSGQLRALYEGWRNEIVEMMAMAEASVDFADEEDVPQEYALATSAEDLSRRIDRHLEQARAGEIIRGGFHVVLVGAPNAGKSSLLNRIAGREVAIVTHEAGTTRDIISVDLDLGGLLVKLSDTAGIREAAGLVEQIGVRRSLEEMERADFVILVEDMHAPETISLAERIPPLLRIGNKADLACFRASQYDIAVSAKTGAGIEELLERIREQAEAATLHSEMIPARERHRVLLRECRQALSRVSDREEIALQVENLRLAAHALGRITGRVDVEDLLDVIFSRFCVGK